MLEIKENQQSNLELTIPESRDRLEILDKLLRHSHASVWADLLEPYCCNGSYTSIDPEIWGVGLTTDPYILVQEACLSDDGEYLEVTGSLWHYPDHALSDVVERLVVGEVVILKHAQDFKSERLHRI